MIDINPQRLLADLRELATFGKYGTGVHRVAFSQEDLEARGWLRDQLAAIGLEAQIDGVGNVLGRSCHPSSALLVGSHTDTVPKGGWLDGALGVIYALEIARAFRENPATRERAVDVVSFQDEEGTFLPCLGSRSFCGDLTEDEIDAARSIEGKSLRCAIREHGLEAGARLRLEPGRYKAFLETHIEQGPRMEAQGLRIGVVTGVVGIRRFRVLFTGEANHAGTTPMAMRKDAGAALIDLANALRSAWRRIAGGDTVWNFGKVAFEPGAANVVPASAELQVETRDTEPATLDRLEACLRSLAAEAAAQGPVGVAVQRTATIDPTPMDAEIGRRVAAAAERWGAPHAFLPSGAGHDAMILARHLPSALMFVPSIGGRSHDVSEATDEADIILGCQVMATAAAMILAGEA